MRELRDKEGRFIQRV
jgi:hypothetical protein